MNVQVNRAEQLWKNWQDTEKELRKLPGLPQETEKTIQKLKYDFLRRGLYRLTAPSENEQLYLHVIRSVTGKLRKELFPNRIMRLLQNAKEFLYDRPLHVKEFNKHKDENIRELQAQFKTAGLSSFTGKLENYLDYESPRVNIGMTAQLDDRKRLDATIHLIKDRTGYYRLDGYDAAIKQPGSENADRSFSFPKESNVMIAEAANLLQERPVCKSMETAGGSMEKRWVQLDFSGNQPKLQEFHEDYGFDLKKELLAVSSLLRMHGLVNQKTIQSLESGNLIQLELPGKEKHFLHANPAERTLSFYDSNRQPVALSDLVPNEDHKVPVAGAPQMRLLKVDTSENRHRGLTL